MRKADDYIQAFFSVFCSNCSVVLFNNRFCYCKTDTGTVWICVVCSVKTAEQLWQVLVRYSTTIIRYANIS